MASEKSIVEQDSFKEFLVDINNVTLPGQLDESSPFSFDQRPNIPFSPTSPGKRSPGRPRTMKEYEDEISSLKKENFNLKVRIFFIEQNRMDLNLPKDVEELRIRLTDLTVDFESKKKELSDTEDLLLKSYKVLDTQKKQLEVIKSDQETEKQALQNKIDALEKELKEYHMRFMETSVHLDDTNALYALTFGLNNKPGLEKEDNSNEKVKYLEHDLNELEDVLKERDHFKESANEYLGKLTVLEKEIKMKSEVLKQKENEVDILKSHLKAQERKFAELAQQQEKPTSDLHRKLIKSLTIENKRLKEQIKEIQNHSESLSSKDASRSSRGQQTCPGWSDHESELHKQLKESQLKIEALQKEVKQFKSVNCNGQTLIQTLIRENKTLKRSLEVAKANSCSNSGSQMNFSKEEVTRKKQS